MRVTFARWAAAVLVCCASIAAVLVPIPERPQLAWFGSGSSPLAPSVAAFANAARDLNDAVRSYRVSQALARWRATKSTDAVQIDASVPASVAEFMRGIAREQWQRAGSSASPTHAAVFVYFDTSAVPMPPSRRNRPVDGRRPADVWYALPEITDGKRCVVIIRVRASAAAQLTQWAEQSLLGPCAYYAAFGKPGPNIHRWLQATDYRGARRPDWDRPRPQVVDAAAVYALGDVASRCLTGSDTHCRRAVRGTPSDSTPIHVIDGNWLGERAGRTLALGGSSPRFLADAVREVGPTRFATFWASHAPLDSAFLAASGVSLEQWTAQWLERSYGSPQPAPVVRTRELLWLAVAMPLLILVAASKRERVLRETLLPVRA